MDQEHRVKKGKKKKKGCVLVCVFRGVCAFGQESVTKTCAFCLSLMRLQSSLGQLWDYQTTTQAAYSQTPMPFIVWAGCPTVFCLLHWVNVSCVEHMQGIENFWVLGFGILRMNCWFPATPSNDSEWDQVLTGKDIYCNSMHIHKDFCV